MNGLKLTTSHIKILDTIELLNKDGFFPLPEGVYKIVTAQEDEEADKFNKYPTYGTLISFNSKKVSRYILMLVRYGYLEKIFHRPTNDLYLHITDFGSMELVNFHKKHKYSFVKKTPLKKTTIVRFEEDNE